MAAGKQKESLCPWLTAPSIPAAQKPPQVVQEPPAIAPSATSEREPTCISADDRGVFVVKPSQYPVYIQIEKPVSDTSGPSDTFEPKAPDVDRYACARQAELVRATNQVLGAGYLNPGVLSRACKSGEIATNGKTGRGSMVDVRSYIVWLGRKRQIPKNELDQVRNAVIGEISERPPRKKLPPIPSPPPTHDVRGQSAST